MAWMDGDADWVPYSQRTPEGKAAFDEALAEVKHFGEIAEEEAHREEAEYFAKREEASEAEWDRRLAMRVAEREAIEDGLSEPWPRVAERVGAALAEQDSIDARHWGVLHPERGWSHAYGAVFSTTHRAIAEAQCMVVQKWGWSDSELWEVRCIEEWAHEQRQ